MVLSLVQPEQMKDTRKLIRDVELDAEVTAPEVKGTRPVRSQPQARRVNDERRPKPARQSDQPPSVGRRPNRGARRAHLQPGAPRRDATRRA